MAHMLLVNYEIGKQLVQPIPAICRILLLRQQPECAIKSVRYSEFQVGHIHDLVDVRDSSIMVSLFSFGCC